MRPATLRCLLPLRSVALLLLPALASLGCSSPSIEQVTRPDFDASRYQRVAVVGTLQGGSTQAMVDEFLLRMLGRGIDVVDSATVDAARQKLKLTDASMASAGDRAKVGRATGVQGMLVINFTTDGKLIIVSAKLFDVDTSEMVWMATGEGKVSSGMAGVVGAVGGAAVGYKLGGGGGAIAGGLIVGRAAAELAPKQLETAKEVVKTLVSAMPLN